MISWWAKLALLPGLCLASPAMATTLTLDGVPQVVFDSATDGCSGIDTPDLNARAFRKANGEVVLFGLHFINRVLRGPDLSHLKIDCHVVLGSIENRNPAAFEGRSYIASVWTEDGAQVNAIVHNEYHGDQFGTCPVNTELGCWWNSLLAFRSSDGGENFAKATPAIIAVAPFRQEVEQGRHRGFFQPSNIVADGKYRYFFGGTTGWKGQVAGDCLFRSDKPEDAASWRAFDGKEYTVTFPDPYASTVVPRPAPCKVIAPFAFPLGAVLKRRGTAEWVAVFQAMRNANEFPLDGFYYATGKSLTEWGPPRLLVAGKTLYNGACGSPGLVLAYPSLLDEQAQGRNFDDTGTRPWLYYAELGTKNCDFTGLRRLMRVRLEIDGGD